MLRMSGHGVAALAALALLLAAQLSLAAMPVDLSRVPAPQHAQGQRVHVTLRAEQSAVSEKADQYSDLIVQPLLENLPRLDMSGTAHKPSDTSPAFFNALFSDMGSLGDCTGSIGSTPSDACAYLDFILIMMGIGVVLPTAAVVLSLIFCFGRCFCSCCCNYCGGKTSAKGDYTPTVIGITFGCYIVGLLALLGFSLGGALSTMKVNDNVRDFIDVGINLGKAPVTLKNDHFVPKLETAKTNGVTRFDGLNSYMSGLPATDSSVTTLEEMLAALDARLQRVDDLSSQTKVNPTSPVPAVAAATGTPLTVDRVELNVVRLEVLAINVSKVNKPLDSSKVGSAFDEATGTAIGELDKLGDSMDGALVGTFEGFHDSFDGVADYITISNFVLWGIVWLAVIIGIVALLVRKSFLFWWSYVCVLIMVPLFFDIFLLMFPLGLIFGDLCDILPIPEGPDSTQLSVAMGGRDDSSLIIGVFDDCILSPDGSIFEAFKVNRSVITDAFSQFDMDKTVPSSTINSTLTVKSPQQKFNALLPAINNISLADTSITSSNLDSCLNELKVWGGIYGLQTFDTLADVRLMDCSGTNDCLTCSRCVGPGGAGTGPVPMCNTTIINALQLEATIAAIKTDAAAISAKFVSVDAEMATSRNNITTMKGQVKVVIDEEFVVAINDMTKCSAVLGTHWAELHGVLCGNFSKTLDSFWFSCFLLGLSMLGFLMCAMKSSKRLSKGGGGRDDRNANYKKSGKGGAKGDKKGAPKKKKLAKNKVAPADGSKAAPKKKKSSGDKKKKTKK